MIRKLSSASQELIGVHQEQLLRELDMYQEIAVAKGLEYDSLNVKMDHCQESIETLSDEIQRLQGERATRSGFRRHSVGHVTPPTKLPSRARAVFPYFDRLTTIKG